MSELPAGTPNTSFSQILPGLQLGVDSTSLGAFKTCPRYYQLSIVEGWQPKDQSVHLTFGIHLHKARESYERAKAEGQGHDDALDLVLDEALRGTWDRGLKRPWISDHKLKNRDTLLRTIVWYLDQFGQNDPFETVILSNGKPAVELSFKFDSGYKSEATGESFVLCGHLDRLAKYGDNYYIPDIKTTGSTMNGFFFDGFSPDNQFSLYTFASKVVFNFDVRSLVVDGIQIAVGFSRCERGLVQRPPAVIAEWYQELGHWLAQMELCAEREHWPMNDKACGNYGGCRFRKVCSKPPSQRKAHLESEFTKRVWDPFVSREA